MLVKIVNIFIIIPVSLRNVFVETMLLKLRDDELAVHTILHFFFKLIFKFYCSVLVTKFKQSNFVKQKKIAKRYYQAVTQLSSN